MHLKFGSYPVVVASSAEMAVEFLKSHDQIFATRPPHAAGKYTAYNYNDVLWAPYGPHWRQGRKIYQNELFSSKRLESFEYIRVEEMWAFVSRLYGLSGKPVVLIEHLTRLTLSNISRMGYIKRMKTLKKKLDRFHDHVFDEHKRKKKELGKDFVAQDMVDLLLQLADGPDLDVKLTYDAVRGLTPGRSFELLPFGAGRRMCPGYNLGLKMIQLSIANLLQAFNWKLPGNIKVEDLSMEEAPGITAPRKFPLVAVLEPRLPLHLYEL
ncbi:hypothetical protein V6N13_057990 [Hibiscus sabdariffa]